MRFPAFSVRPGRRASDKLPGRDRRGDHHSPIIKIVTTVAILAAVYFFIVGPILDTTEDTVRNARGQFQESQRQADADATAADISSTRTSATSYGRGLIAGSQPWEEAAKTVLRCVENAGDDIAKLERCEELGQTITSKVLHNRNFADS